MKTLIAWLAFAGTLAFTNGAGAATVLITGSDRGMGFEFARQYAGRGWTVIATTRHPETATALKALAEKNSNIVIEKLDVLDLPGIKALAEKYKGQPIDILINNAGIGGDNQGQTLGSFDYANFQQVMGVNVYGALAVTEAFRDNVILSGQKKIIAITSGAGSLNRPGGGPSFYRASKAALNMCMKCLAHDLHDKGVIVGMLVPGAVDTGHHVPGRFVNEEVYRKIVQQPNVAVAAMIKVIDGLTQANSDKPINFDGTVFPW